MNMGQCPADPGHVKTTGYPGILVNVPRIIVVNEVVLENLAKDDPRDNYQANRDAQSHRVTRYANPSHCFGLNTLHWDAEMSR
jgi:hypothetical protein